MQEGGEYIMYNNAVDLAKGTKTSIAFTVHLATVKSLAADGRAYVQFYGDSEASGKLYPYVAGYKPAVNDDVLMLKQGSTYIIIGKLLKVKFEDYYYPTKGETDELYAAIDHNHDSAYAAIDHNHDGTYAPSAHDHSRLLAGTYTLTLSSDSAARYLLPNGNKTFDIGSASYMLRRLYTDLMIATKFGGEWSSSPTGNVNTLGWDSASLILPSSDNAVALGSNSKRLSKLHAAKISGAWYYNADGTGTIYYLAWNNTTDILPSSSEKVNLGSSTYKLNKIYAKELYHGGTIITDVIKKLTDNTGNILFTFTSSVKALTPSVNNQIDLGSSSYAFNKAYIKELYLNGSQFTFDGATLKSGSYQVSIDSSGNFKPGTNGTIDIGTSGAQFNNLYAKKLYQNGTAVTEQVEKLAITNYNVLLTRYNGTPYLKPNGNKTIDIGSSSEQFNNCYAKQFYQNGTAISTSDRRAKKYIKDITKKYTDLFMKLRPVSFKFKDGESGRTHTGFIAQEVEEAAEETGIDIKDLAFICKDDNGNYGLRYEELIAIQTKVIQDLYTRVETLEEQVRRLSEK